MQPRRDAVSSRWQARVAQSARKRSGLSDLGAEGWCPWSGTRAGRDALATWRGLGAVDARRLEVVHEQHSDGQPGDAD